MDSYSLSNGTTASPATEAEVPNTTKREISYRVICHSDDKGVFEFPRKEFSSAKPFTNLEESHDDKVFADKDEEKHPLVFEICTDIACHQRASANGKDVTFSIKSTESKDGQAGEIDVKDIKLEDVKLEDLVITEVFPSYMSIFSQPLLAILRSVVGYYPSQALSGDDIEIEEPYAVLLHYFPQLQKQKSILAGNQQGCVAQLESIEGTDSSALQHLDLLLEFLEPIYDKVMTPIKRKFEREIPVVSFDTLWALFKPGEDLYWEKGSFQQTAVMMKSYLEDSTEAKDRGASDNGWVVRAFWLESDGTKMGRNSSRIGSIVIDYFEGEKPITSLDAFPCRFWDLVDNGARRQRHAEIGEKAFKIIQSKGQHMLASGVCMDDSTVLVENQLVVADIPMFLRYGEDDGADDWDLLQQTLDVDEEHWKGYDKISLEDTQELTAHQYFLLHQAIPCYVLKAKEWRVFNAGDLQDSIPDRTGLQNLVLEPDKVEILEAVCATRYLPWKVDFTEQKGEGQTIILHGPPGVGKTYTVESFSQALGRPLLSLTVADVGVEGTKMEELLVKWFILAEAWNAMLLIDEADIFMERRSHTDIGRNGLVSVFLRQMEYFKGVLFLTTNRLGQIDDAFLSRIHIVLEYPLLAAKGRADIWNGFFNKLERDMAEKRKGDAVKDSSPIIVIDEYAKKYVLNDEQVEKLEWNGREIRNALQTAISLAVYSAKRGGRKTTTAGNSGHSIVEVEKKDFISVAIMSEQCRRYIHTITGQGQEQNARNRYDRGLATPSKNS